MVSGQRDDVCGNVRRRNIARITGFESFSEVGKMLVCNECAVIHLQIYWFQAESTVLKAFYSVLSGKG